MDFHPRQRSAVAYRYLKFAAAGAVLLLIGVCAKEGVPPGGPEDRTAPRVIATIPSPEATGQANLREISIEFSERINRSGVEDAVYIAPVPTVPPVFRWKGTELRIMLQTPPDSGRTYIVSIGASVADMRGNVMDASYLFAFSTGDSLDRNAVGGAVRTAGLDGSAAVVWAMLPDSTDGLLPAGRPAYVTQAGRDGRFGFRYMGAGTYRLLAFVDRNGNGVPDIGRELVGGSDRDIPAEPGDGSLIDAEIVLTAADTALTVPLRTVLCGPRRFEAVFTLPVDTGSRTSALFTVTNSSGIADTGEYTMMMRHPDDNSVTVLYRDTVSVESVCSVGIAGVATVGGPILHDTTRLALAFEPFDTTRPTLVKIKPARNSKNAHPDAPVDLEFSMLMDTGVIPDVLLKDSSGMVLPSTVSWHTPGKLRCRPGVPLAGRMRHTFAFNTATCRGCNGVAGYDTMLTVAFTTVPADTLGGIRGRVSGIPGTGPVIVFAREKGVVGGEDYRCPADALGRFSFLRLSPGIYFLYAVADADGDGYHTAVHLQPFRFMEPLAVLEKPVTVRPLWEVENVVLPFPGMLHKEAGNEHTIH